MRIGVEDVTINDSSEFGRDFMVKMSDSDKTYIGRLGAFCVGDISELYLVTSEPTVYSMAIAHTPERLEYMLNNEKNSVYQIVNMLNDLVQMAEQEI
jgi:hypothetical protein